VFCKTALVLSCFVAALPAFAADGIAWGAAAGGLRIGIDYSATTAEPEIRVIVENVGESPLDVLVGNRVGTGIAVTFRFLVTGAGGKEHEGHELNSFTPITGLITPVVVRLEPGASHEMDFPLKNIRFVEKLLFDATLATLVKQGCSVRVSLESDDKTALWAAMQSPWIGRLTSGVLLPPPAGNTAPRDR